MCLLSGHGCPRHRKAPPEETLPLQLNKQHTPLQVGVSVWQAGVGAYRGEPQPDLLHFSAPAPQKIRQVHTLHAQWPCHFRCKGKPESRLGTRDATRPGMSGTKQLRKKKVTRRGNDELKKKNNIQRSSRILPTLVSITLTSTKVCQQICVPLRICSVKYSVQ